MLDSCEIGASHTKDGVSWGHSGLSGPLGWLSCAAQPLPLPLGEMYSP